MAKIPKLKIGLVFDDSLDSADGVAQHVKTLGAWLSSQGHQVSYLVGETKTKQWSGGQVHSLARNQKVYFNGNWLSMPLPASAAPIKQVLEDGQFDVLHAMMPFSPFMAQKIIKLASIQTAIVGTFHIYPAGGMVRAGSRLLKFLYGRSLIRFSDVISVSSAAAQFAKATFGLESTIIPNPVDTSLYNRPKAKRPHTKDKQIVFLGRLVKRKGAHQLIEAFAVLLESLPSAKLTLAGDGPLRNELQKLVEKLGISPNISFLGFIDESDKPSLLAGADVACFPSMYGESFGIVLVEAMAAGAGVVLGGDNPGYRSVLGAQPDLLIDPTDRQAFAGQLHELLTNEALRKQLHIWQESQIKKYDIETVGPQLEEVYASAIARLNKNGHNVAHE